MTCITQAFLCEATLAVDRMGIAERLRLADEVFAHQPNLLASVVVLRRMGASDAQIDIPVHVLLVAWQAMKSSGLQWPLISEDDQDTCMQRLTARMRFAEGLSGELFELAVVQHVNSHGERYLLAFAYGYLRDHGLLGVTTEAEKYVLLATLNLVECIAFAAPRSRAVASRGAPATP
jgi:hypothetical protein